MADMKESLLDKTIKNINQALLDPEIFSKPVTLDANDAGVTFYRIKGPRAGAIEMFAGSNTGTVFRTFTKDDAAILRQLIAWQYPEDRKPMCYLTGNRVRIEAPWPDALQTKDITLDSARYHADGRRFTTGIDERGTTIRVAFSSEVPHILVAGNTGSGKSFSMRSMAAQLGHSPDCRLILIDGKYGDGLMPLSWLNNQIGPVATTVEEARSAMGWAVQEMVRRYRKNTEDNTYIAKQPRIIIITDEFQEMTYDPVFSAGFREIGAKGRGAGISLLAATQYPRQDMFGTDSRSQTLKQHFVGRIVHAVGTLEASMLAVGDSFPRADRTLLGRGDAYVLPKPGIMYRVQMAYIPENQLFSWKATEEPMGKLFDKWPVYDAMDMEASMQVPEKGSPGRKARMFSGEEIAGALWHQLGNLGGRDALTAFLKDRFKVEIGAGATARLIDLASSISTAYRDLGGDFIV